MTNKILAILLILGLLHPSWTQAIDLLEVYEVAQEQDPAVRRVRESLEATRESKPQAKSRLLPAVGLSADAQYTDLHLRRSNYAISDDLFVQKDLTLQISQPLYHRDYWIQLDQTDDVIAQAETKLAGAEIELMVRTAKAYFRVLASADDLRTANAEKAANALQLEQATKRFKVGAIAMTDVHEVQAAYDYALAQSITAENALSNAWGALYEITGELHQPIAILGESLSLHAPTPDNVERWAEIALQNNYEIRTAQKAVEQARKAIDLQHAGYFPIVDLVASYGMSDSDSDIGTNRDTGTIGIKLSVPLYQGGLVSSKERQAVHEHKAAQEALDQQRRLVNRQVRDSYRGILSSISQVSAFKSAVISFETALKASQAGMLVGTRTMVDILDTTKSLYLAQRNYARARYEYIINGLTLQYAAGTLNKNTIEKANSWLTPAKTQPPS